MKQLFFVICNFFAVTEAAFAWEQSGKSLVQDITTYPDHGGGDFIFHVEIPGPICTGYWLSPSSECFNTNVSTILSAFHANKPLLVYGLTELSNKWSGSGTHFCKVYAVAMSKS